MQTAIDWKINENIIITFFPEVYTYIVATKRMQTSMARMQLVFEVYTQPTQTETQQFIAWLKQHCIIIYPTRKPFSALIKEGNAENH